MGSMGKSGIPYADYAWNPTTGCQPGHPCYARCWARAMHSRFHPGETFAPRMHVTRLDQPLRTRKPGVVAVSFGGDLFADGISDEMIAAVFCVAVKAPQHTFLILTKRPQRMARLWTVFPHDSEFPAKNILLGTSVSTQAEADTRVPYLWALAQMGWRTWVSVEPMLGPVDLDIDRIERTEDDGQAFFLHSAACESFCDYGCGGQELHTRPGEPDRNFPDWVVAGAESGPGARALGLPLIRSLRDECRDHHVPFFYKQGPSCDDLTPFAPMGAWQREVQVGNKTTLLPILDGRTHVAMPEVLKCER